MAKIRFYPVDITYKVKDGKPVIYIFGRTDKGEQVCVEDSSFRRSKDKRQDSKSIC
jgi:DNA polymerase elongation subunit (family B)